MQLRIESALLKFDAAVDRLETRRGPYVFNQSTLVLEGVTLAEMVELMV